MRTVPNRSGDPIYRHSSRSGNTVRGLFERIRDLFFENAPIFDIGPKQSESGTSEAMADSDIKDLFQKFNDCCDAEEIDLKEAIAYSLRILRGSESANDLKKPGPSQHELRTSEISPMREPEVDLSPQPRKA